MYIIIELFPSTEEACIVTNPDGSNMLFEHKGDAILESQDLQNPLIVEVP